jgi:hypothetical protein
MRMAEPTVDGTKVRVLAVPIAAGLLYALIGVWWLRFVYLSDFYQMIWLADAQRAGVATAYANGFLGMGYPGALNVITWVTGNILTSGKLIQAVSGAAVLLMLPAVMRHAFGDSRGSLWAQGLLAVDAVFVFAAAGETPDLLATAFMVASVLAATAFIRRPSAPAACAVGLALGLGYLVRYHCVLLLPWITLAMAVLAPRHRRASLWALVAFLVAASPQLIASAVVQGNPLFNLHIKSIAMGYYGVSSDFVEKTRPYTLWRILSESPAAVAKQYATFAARYFTEIGGSILLLGGAFLSTRGESRGWAVLALPAIALTGLLATKFYTDRAILFQLVMWYLVVGRVLAQLAGPAESRWTRVVAVALAVGIASSSVLDAGRTWSRMARLRDRNSEITMLLHRAGIDNSRRVFTTHLSYYLADDPGGGPFYPHDTWLLYDPSYARAYPHAYLTDVASLDAFAEQHHLRYFLSGPLTADAAPAVFEAQRAGSLGPRFRLLKNWGDLALYEHVGS